MNNRKSGGTGIAILLTVGVMFLIGFGINSSKPKCAMGGCNKERTNDSQYCVLHDLSYRSYGNPDYNAVYKQSQEKRKNNTSNTVSDTGIKNNSNSQSSYNINNKKTYTGKSYGSSAGKCGEGEALSCGAFEAWNMYWARKRTSHPVRG